MQKTLANWIADVLSEKLHTKVEIGNVNLGLLNRIAISDFSIFDQNGEEMLKAARLSAGLNYRQILRGRMHFSTIQFFSPTLHTYRDSANAVPNYQFVIDLLNSDSDDESAIDLRINRLLLRHANISYDVWDQPQRRQTDTLSTVHQLDVNHLRLSDVGGDFVLKAFTPDSINLSVKRLAAAELNSGLTLVNLDFNLEANIQESRLYDLHLQTQNSTLSIENLAVCYPDFDQKGTFSFSPFSLTAYVIPADFKSLLPVLKGAYTPMHLTARISGDSEKIDIGHLNIRNAIGNMRFESEASFTFSPQQPHRLELAKIDIADLRISADGIQQLIRELDIDQDVSTLLTALGTIDYSGIISHTRQHISSEGLLHTSAGTVEYTAQLDTMQIFKAHVNATDFDMGAVLGNENYGITNLEAELVTLRQDIKQLQAIFSISGPAIELSSDLQYSRQNGTHDLNVASLVSKINPHALSLTTKASHDEYRGQLNAHLTGSSIDDLQGTVNICPFQLRTDTCSYDIETVDLSISRQQDDSHITLTTDFARAVIDGEITLSVLTSQLTAMLHPHLHRFLPDSQHSALRTHAGKSNASPNNLSYTVEIQPHPILGHVLPADCHITSPLSLSGFVNTELQQFSLTLVTKKLLYSDREFTDVKLQCDNTAEQLTASLSSSYLQEETTGTLQLNANARNSVIDSNVALQLHGNSDINLNLNSAVSFTDSLGQTSTDIDIQHSLLIINDTTWNISPARITFSDKTITCKDLQISDPSGSYIKISGAASPSPDDSLVAHINGLQIEYILDIIDFQTIALGGKASGTIVLDDPFSETPLMRADLNIQDLLFEHASLGYTTLTAQWDNPAKAILLNAYMSPLFSSSSTSLHGYISPENNDIRLDITANKTTAEFLNAYLDDIFHPLTGDITGEISVVGPLDNINLVGNADANLNLALLATNVPYEVSQQHVTLEPNRIVFSDVTLTDHHQGRALLNGEVTHTNLANFKYDFDINFTKMLAYDEHTFNEDNFYATIYADGNLKIQGRDGHPMYITADITPTAGSLFAYDSASPDAITSGNFIEFRDMTSQFSDTMETQNIAQSQPISTRYLYHGDLYMNFNINLNEACQIRLRMDNNADGYITTYGRGNINAQYHNKGTLQLFGTYYIQRGNYRLYMQDLIYKDLTLQQGSTVEFNGLPFDANIHLICHHLVNAVPLSDLTATTAYAANNKVKVNCILDITGKLGNMAFKFDVDIPNASDETKQLVHSMINSEEEMNTQIIYLLALGRFYPSSLSETNSEGASSSAVNSLVSSTLSGQLNNIIGNLIGSNSNWNFGTGIVTGERGWQDLDVEGTLSGRLFNDRLLINGNFGYRDNTLTNTGTIIGDFELKWRLSKESGNMYLKAYNQTNDRYFTKATLNTQGVGLSYVHDFENWKNIFKRQ